MQEQSEGMGAALAWMALIPAVALGALLLLPGPSFLSPELALGPVLLLIVAVLLRMTIGKGATRLVVEGPWISVDGARRHLNTVRSVVYVTGPNSALDMRDTPIRTRGLFITWSDAPKTMIWGSRHPSQDLRWLVQVLQELASEHTLTAQEVNDVAATKRKLTAMQGRKQGEQ